MDYKAIISDPNNLYEALIKAIDGSKWKESSQNASLLFLDVIFELSKDLRNQTYKNGDEFKFILHERGKTRPITSLTVRDRIVRHVLCDKIFMPLIREKIIYDNGASLKGRGLSFTKKRFSVHLHKYFNEYHTNKGFILFGDFSKFYDNIRHDLAKDILLELVDYDEYVTWLLDLIFYRFIIDASDMTEYEYLSAKNGVFDKLQYTYPINNNRTKTIEKSINIGDQLAQAIGIYYPHKIDTYVKTVCQIKYYGRYMDDWYIVHPSKKYLHKVLHGINDLSLSLGLHINLNKTKIIPLQKPFTFLQTHYYFSSTGRVCTRIKSKRVTSMRQRLKKLYYKNLNGEVEYDNIENMFKSWIGSFYKMLSHEQLSNLIQLYENLFSCTITIHDGKMYMEKI